MPFPRTSGKFWVRVLRLCIFNSVVGTTRLWLRVLTARAEPDGQGIPNRDWVEKAERVLQGVQRRLEGMGRGPLLP